jgi:polar amino acid transport system substrate-binding protein
MMMKRFVSIGLLSLLCILLGFCGCSFTKNSAETEADLPELRIGIDANYEPYSYIDENGSYAGLDIDLAVEACSRMGYSAKFVPIKWDDKNSYLENDSIDCIWSCFTMSGREEAYDWVGPYMYSRQVVVVRNDSPITTLSDLEGRCVAVMSSTKPEQIFLNSQDDINIPDVDDIYCMENMDLVFSALQYGYVDAAAGHETTIKQFMDSMTGKYRILDTPLLSVEVGIAFKTGSNTEIQVALNSALSDMQNDGTLSSILESYGVDAELQDGGDV